MLRIDFPVFEISRKETHLGIGKHVILDRTILRDHPECVIFVKHNLSCGLEELYFRDEAKKKAMFENHCYLSAAN